MRIEKILKPRNYYLMLLLISMISNGQVTKDLPNYFPVSPNAASFAKQGIFPVDYSTGKINIIIPLYTIKTKEVTVPIDLNYNSAGIQLDELASWAGLGWNLNAGGAVIRNVKGVPDNGVGVPDITNTPFTASGYNELYKQYNPYSSIISDTAYDEFIINAPGLSGTFYFVNNKAVFKDLQNTVVKTLVNNNQLLSKTPTLEITKDDGTVYRFGRALDGYDANEIVHNTSDTYKSDYISVWYLTEIIPPSSTDIISFKYKVLDNTSDYAIVIGEQLADNDITSNITPSLKSVFPDRSSSNKQFLTAINFNNGVVEFVSSQNRLDLTEDYKLDKISVFSLKGAVKTLIQEYGFVFDYYLRSRGFTTSQPPTLSDNVTYSYTSARNIASRNKSLKLTQITNNILNVKHIFEYDETELPLRGTTRKDYWGYINTNNGNLSPPTFINRFSPYGAPGISYIVGNGDRTANENAMKSGILKKITYPEGGHSIFEYETNRYFENIATPTVVYKSATAVAYGSGCSYDAGPSTQTISFTPSSTYVGGSGKITYGFTNATKEVGSNTKVTFDSNTYFRPAPVGSSYPSGGGTIAADFGAHTHTLGAYEYRTGNMGAAGCPSSYITASWNEISNPGIPVLTPKLVGGLRIVSIKSYDGKNASPVFTKLYQYANENPLVKEGNGTYVRGIFYANVKSDVIPVFSTSAIFDNNNSGSAAITYGKVTETDYNTQNRTQNGKTEYFYENIALNRMFDINAGNLPTLFKSPSFNIAQAYDIGLPINSLTNFAFFKNDQWNQGSLIRTNIYKNGETANTFKIVKSIVNQYTVLKESALRYNIIFNNYPTPTLPGDYPVSFNLPYVQGSDFYSGMFYYAVGQTSQGKKQITKTIETDYDINEAATIEKITTYSYENPVHYQITNAETFISKSEIIKNKYYYPQDPEMASEPFVKELIAANRIATPLNTQVFKDKNKLSEQKTVYEKSVTTSNLLLPKYILENKGAATLAVATDKKITFNQYDDKGNALQYTPESGIPVSIIWGYNKTLAVVKIENIAYTSIPISLINDLTTASSNTGTEAQMAAVIKKLYQDPGLANTMITGYTYKPLIGVTSVTDSKGLITFYEYDSFNRLQFVKDADGNLLSENQYHYKE
ncbi:RHS repeat domain-containing protein [uncultured Flavobacterium sp.]|uniref:RHS repeat domain-containing protein n=1 Tax=uncultured Flavobacterium sp. TaxID=165435 RepID=UPI00308188E2